jgi:hypothetical protein
MGIDGGELSIEKWTLPRHVHDTTYNSVGDGAFTALTTLPGKLMVDSGIVSWTSDSPLPCRVLLRLQRAYRSLLVSNPNAAQIRDRYTYTTNGTDPRVPDVSSSYQAQTGAAIDLSANFQGTPYLGKYWVHEDAAIIEDWIGPVPAGGTLKLWYRANLWTPPPFSNNANGGSPVHEAYARSTRIQLIAFPQQDTEVMS